MFTDQKFEFNLIQNSCALFIYSTAVPLTLKPRPALHKKKAGFFDVIDLLSLARYYQCHFHLRPTSNQCAVMHCTLKQMSFRICSRVNNV